MNVRLASALFALSVWAPTAKAIVLGEVNIREVVLGVKQGQDIQKELKEEHEKRIKIVKDDEAAIVKMQEDLAKADEDFRKQSAVMNAERRAQRQRELQEKFAAFQRKRVELAQKTDRFEQEMQTMENERNAPLLERIRKVIDDVSKKANVDFTYRSPASPIIYAKEVRDLTSDVIRSYDAQHK